MSLFIPTYFSPISQYIAITQSDQVIFEVEDNFQKQSYRNRCYIYGANGKQLLNIPVKHPSSTKKKKTKDTLVDNTSNWQSQHLKSLQAAYRNSPFYEFYEDDIISVFTKKYKYLLDVNIDTFLCITNAIEISQKFSKTTDYEHLNSKEDLRFLADVKTSRKTQHLRYKQIFEEKHGYIKNLSIFDLLFMEGPNTISYLEEKLNP